MLATTVGGAWACGPARDAENVKVSGVDAGGVPDAGPLPEPPRTCGGEMQRCMRGNCTRVRDACANSYVPPVDAPRCDPQCESAANCRVKCDHDTTPECLDKCTESLDERARQCANRCVQDDACIRGCFKAGCSSVVCAFR